MSAEKIKLNGDGTLNVPANVAIPFIEGDGVGPDVWKASRIVFDEAVKKCYGGKKKVSWKEILAGEKAFKQTGSWLPDETLNEIKSHKVAIKGPLTTPVGGGIRSVNVALRQVLDLYACVRPVRYYKGVPSPLKHPEQVDMVIFRENTEDVYAGIEYAAESKEAKEIISLLERLGSKEIRAESAIGIKPVSKFGSRRLIEMAIVYAISQKRPSVTMVHKGNIMKFTEGAFCSWGYELAKEKFRDNLVAEKDIPSGSKAASGKVLINDRIADNMFQQVLLRPSEYSVVATLNLNGDYLSDALAAEVGGLGLAPGGNIGKEYAVFEATHGTAPKYAGQDKVNPGSLILSGKMLFDHLGWTEVGERIDRALEATIGEGIVTYDLARGMQSAREVSCSKFAEEIAKRI